MFLNIAVACLIRITTIIHCSVTCDCMVHGDFCNTCCGCHYVRLLHVLYALLSCNSQTPDYTKNVCLVSIHFKIVFHQKNQQTVFKFFRIIANAALRSPCKMSVCSEKVPASDDLPFKYWLFIFKPIPKLLIGSKKQCYSGTWLYSINVPPLGNIKALVCH